MRGGGLQSPAHRILSLSSVNHSNVARGDQFPVFQEMSPQTRKCVSLPFPIHPGSLDWTKGAGLSGAEEQNRVQPFVGANLGR
jgi:hypothetical protein